MKVALGCLVLAACSYHPPRATGGDAPGDPGDAPVDVPIDIVTGNGGIDFLPEAEETFATGKWTIAIDTTIDTTSVSILAGETLPASVTLLVGTQDSGGSITR